MALQKYQIQEGPGKYAFERAVMDGALVEFTFFGVSHRFEIRSVECIDVTRDSWWMVKGYKREIGEKGSFIHFSACYSLRTHKGEIEIDLLAGR